MRSPETVDHPSWDCRTGTAADSRSPRSVDALGWSRTSQGPIVLLVVVVLVEVAFVVWNEGHLPGAKKATGEKPPQG